ncbi:hypothetical protein [Roseinatronobacter sp.]|uniref:hypothetical protein n=1 Tax=Roseinatronobacter sp. TaxID=1945755 RepID=UPI0025D36EBD|nr:hypothetical protein [Roseibaca sp.]
MITITRKRGDTRRLRFHTTFALDGLSVAAAARDSGGATRTLQAAVIDAPARLYDLWGLEALPVGRHAVDMRYERAGHIQRSETFFLQITEAMTP